MSFNTKKNQYGREHIYIVEMDMDHCANTHAASPCMAGRRSLVTTIVAVDDFAEGDKIRGDDTEAEAIITLIEGTSPVYTFTYTITNGIDFKSGGYETIRNISTDKTGVCSKNTSSPVIDVVVGSQCYNTLTSCQSAANYNNTTESSAATINASATGTPVVGTFTRTSGSFLSDGFVVGDKITTSGFGTNDENNSTFIIDALTATVITVVDPQNMVTESGIGYEVVSKKVIKTFSFCESRSPYPTGMTVAAGDPDVIPSLKSVNISAAKIDIKGGLGVRSNVGLTFKDHPSSDINMDDHLSTRLQDAYSTGTFWTKFKARYANYEHRALRVKSGYIDNGGEYNDLNFEARHYVIDRIDVSKGSASVVGKDPLKLVGSKKAQAPSVRKGLTDGSITSGANSSFDVGSGEGAEYGADGWVLLDSEVIKYERTNDTFDIIERGAYNTTQAAHSSGVTVHECLVYERETVDKIVYDLLVNYTNIDPTFISVASWASEIENFLTGNLSGIIVKPYDVKKLLIELSENKAHYLWWDEVTAKIQLTALRPPPDSANTLNMDEHLIKGSVSIKDNPQMRVSTVFVNFGQYNPTLKLDDVGNYRQSVARVDADSIAKYGSNQIRVINSRWLSNTSKVGALQIATTLGRRFSNQPRVIDFSLDAKDGGSEGVWVGQSKSINHRDVVDFSGMPLDVVYQIISAKEHRDTYKYTALEYTYGGELTDDEASEAEGYKPKRISVSCQNLNLRTLWDETYTLADNDKAKFIVEPNVVIGSTSLSAACDTGTWTDKTGVTVTIIIQSGAFIVGKGGDGGSSAVAGGDGGLALKLAHDVLLTNSGVIGGGGGGGGGGITTSLSGWAGGGGGAGNSAGLKNITWAAISGTLLSDSEDGTKTSGGGGGGVRTTSWWDDIARGGAGGGLGNDGNDGFSEFSLSTSGGNGGDAIDRDGHSWVATTSLGDVRGDEIA